MKIEINENDFKNLMQAACAEVAEEIKTTGNNNITETKYAMASHAGMIMTRIADTGELMGSSFALPDGDGYEVIWRAPHAEYVEFGRVPGSMPPAEPLIRWCNKKLGLTMETAKKILKLIQWKIYHDGIQPRPFVHDAVDTVTIKYEGSKIIEVR